MRQITSNLRSGEMNLQEYPAPSPEAGHVLIGTTRTLVSQGTEKMLVQFGKASLFQKARSQPDKVKQVLQKIRTDGLVPTVEAVFRKLDEPLPLGYCNVGRVIAVGDGVQGFQVGDRVASNGPHAEVVSVPANLCAKVPDNVSDDAAAFTVIGAIGLQGVRLVKPELGETVVVIGLGLIGQITAQLLKASGCRVIGFDFAPDKVAMAARFGVEAVQSGAEVDPVRHVLEKTGGLGADAVIITASTSSNAVIAQSAQMSRKRGRIVLVGVVGLEINRADFYHKELTFQVSCSYGPGRYEDAYEEKGYDYPAAFVRWTENRNFQAVLQAIASGTLQVEPLITRRVPLERYREIYDDMDGGGLASLLVYPAAPAAPGYSLSGTGYSSEPGATSNQQRVTGNEPAAEPAAPGYSLSGAGYSSGAIAPGSEQPVTNNEQPVTGNQEPVTGNEKPVTDNEKRVTDTPATTIKVTAHPYAPAPGALAVVGAGNFTKMTVMPALAAAKAPVKTIVSAGGVTGTSLAKKYGVPFSSTDYGAVVADPDVRGVILATRHNLHAAQVVLALDARKHVLVEKPLCLSIAELQQIKEAMDRYSLAGSRYSSEAAMPRDSLSDTRYPSEQRATDNQQRATDNQQRVTNNEQRVPAASGSITVGFNRRFSPHVQEIKRLLRGAPGPISIVATMNAGAIPLSHWVHDPEVGGGRLVGEACHFVDLAIYVTGSLVEAVAVTALGETTDSASILLRHANGATSVVNYFANGHREVSKERLEVHSAGRSLLLDNFRELLGFGFKSFRRLKTRQDKGHAEQFARFARFVRDGGEPLIPWAEIENSTRATLAIPRAVAERQWVVVG